MTKKFSPKKQAEYKASQAKKAEQFESVIKDSLANLAALTEGARDEQVFKDVLISQSKFWRYSYFNQALLRYQGASMVNSAKRWSELGYHVTKGESGLTICAPLLRKGSKENNEGKREEFSFIRGFKFISKVFDIKQVSPMFAIERDEKGKLAKDENGEFVYKLDNNGEKISLAKPLELDFQTSGEVSQQVVQSLTNVYKDAGVSLTFVNEINGGTSIKGYSEGGSVTILTDDSGKMFTTMLHELAHEHMHQGSGKESHARDIKELEAESVAFIVASHFGLDMSASRFYLASWKADTKKIQESMTRIAKCASDIMSKMESYL